MVDNVLAQDHPAAGDSPPILATHHTTCCIVGAGPAGAVLALLLARQGVPTMLLESHADFDRDFRGDTIHPSVMEIMDELGLTERLLQLPHTKLRSIALPAQQGVAQVVSLERLRTRHPYIVLLPQARFLEFITAEACRYPQFQLVMAATVQRLVESDAGVQGVRYQGRDGWHEVRATLTIGADGRFSRVRKLAGIEPIKTSPAMDVLWFRLPRLAQDPTGIFGGFAGGHAVVLLDRTTEWQIAYIIPKGQYQHIQSAGLEALQRSLASIVPLIADRVAHITSWKQVALLSVEASRVRRWYRPGLLLIGDAAHVMTPIGGVGINYAIQDAVAAANRLSHPLKRGQVRIRDLAAVQWRRELPTRVIQTFQLFAQRQLVNQVFQAHSNRLVSGLFRLVPQVPIIRDLVPRLIAFGLWPVHVKRRV